MNSLILNTTTRLLLVLLLLFSLFLLLRGHNEPGGGFTGGLVAAASFCLYLITYGADATRQLLRIDPKVLAAGGLLLAAIAGFPAFFAGAPFLTGLWDDTPVPLIGKFGTPLIFDVGVYLLVTGVVVAIVLDLAEEA